DCVTGTYLRTRTTERYEPIIGDSDAEFSETISYELNKIEPTVAKPFSPANISAARELQEIEIDKVYIGSCTGAKFDDLQAAARILKGRKVKVRTEVLPAAQSIYIKAVRDGLAKVFLEAAAVVGPPTCGACCSAQTGVL